MASLDSIIKQLKPIDSTAKIDLLVEILKERDTIVDFSIEKKVYCCIKKTELINYYRNKKKSLRHNENISKQIVSDLIASKKPLNSVLKINDIAEEIRKYGYELTLKDKELLRDNITEQIVLNHWNTISENINEEISEGLSTRNKVKTLKNLEKETTDTILYSPPFLYIRNKSKIDLIVKYFKYHKEEITTITDCWIQYNLVRGERRGYYKSLMSTIYPGYDKISKQAKNINIFKITKKRQKKIERLYNNLKEYLENADTENELHKKKEDSSFNVLQKKEWILDWNCVLFQQGAVVIYGRSDIGVKFKPTTIYVKGAQKSFNYLRKYLNERLPPIHCSIEGLNLTILDEINFNDAIKQFSKAARQGVIKTNVSPNVRFAPVRMSFSQALSKAREMTPEEFKKYKSKYIDFLVEHQSKKYKVIPCVERLAHSNSDLTEFAFIFSIECKYGDILVIHENVNPDRSTLMFTVKKENYDKAIRAIFDFLQGAEINKRSNLRDRNLDIKQAGVERYFSINHDLLSSWERYITSYKLRYRNGEAVFVY